MIKATVYNQQGEEVKQIPLPSNVFKVSFQSALLHQVVTAMLANQRYPWAHTKTRGEVRGGGRKPWRQK